MNSGGRCNEVAIHQRGKGRRGEEGQCKGTGVTGPTPGHWNSNSSARIRKAVKPSASRKKPQSPRVLRSKREREIGRESEGESSSSRVDPDACLRSDTLHTTKDNQTSKRAIKLQRQVVQALATVLVVHRSMHGCVTCVICGGGGGGWREQGVTLG